MIDQFARHDRHAAHGCHALAGNDFQGLASIPAIHQHNCAAARGREVSAAIIGRDMEKRSRQQRDRDRGLFGRDWRNTGCAVHGQRLNLSGKHHIEQVGDTAAMSQLRALGHAGGARGIEDTGIGFRINFHLRQAARVADHIRPLDDARRGIGAAHCNQGHALGHVGLFRHAGQTLSIGKHHFWRRILQRIGQFFGHPPGIEADHGDAKAQARPIDQHPFRIIAHADRNPITNLDALRIKPGCNRGDLSMGLGIAQAFIFIDQIGAVSKGSGRQPKLTNIGRSMLETAQVLPANLVFNDFERRAGGNHFFPGLGQLSVMHSSSEGSGLAPV